MIVQKGLSSRDAGPPFNGVLRIGPSHRRYGRYGLWSIVEIHLADVTVDVIDRRFITFIGKIDRCYFVIYFLISRGSWYGRCL